MNFTFNPYAIPPIITFCFVLSAGLFILIKKYQSNSAKLLGLFCLSISGWLFFFSLMYLSPQPEEALNFARIGFWPVAFIPIFAYHFVVNFLNIKQTKLLAVLFYNIFNFIFCSYKIYL